MRIVDRGSGPPLVLITGLQGRWEYMRGTVDALSQSFRVLTFPLCGERGSGMTFDPSRGLDNYVSQVNAVLEGRAIERAIICGISFGGVAAVRFAATTPARTAALILASTPPPVWRLRKRHEFYLRLPWLFGPVFLIETPFRLRAELARTFPTLRQRVRFSLGQLETLLRAPISFRRMGDRGRLLAALNVADDCARITAPSLIVTGERGLDHVVPIDGPSAYERAIASSRAAVIESTGHLGTITRPDVFAALVREFAREIGEMRAPGDGRRSEVA